MRPIRSIAIAALAAGALAVPVSAGAAAPIKVNEKEFSISGVPKTLKHGVKYTVTLSNKGKYPHDLLFDGKGVHDVGIHNKAPVAPMPSCPEITRESICLTTADCLWALGRCHYSSLPGSRSPP